MKSEKPDWREYVLDKYNELAEKYGDAVIASELVATRREAGLSLTDSEGISLMEIQVVGNRLKRLLGG